MEKFALLNLLKAIDGLKDLPRVENEPPEPTTAAPQKQSDGDGVEIPNFMYEAIVRHEAVSNRLRNKK